MKMVIPGGSGHLGSMLARAFTQRGWDVIILSRRPRELTAGRCVYWDGETLGDWQQELSGADLIVNLAGRSVNCRYNRKRREEILHSRVDSTRVLGDAIARQPNPPRLWLQASTATIYAHTLGEAHDEEGTIGEDPAVVPDTWSFSIDVAKAWEAAALTAELPHTRRILLRTAIVMSPDPGGPFDVLLRLVRYGLGGTSGPGNQYVSWIHDEDWVRVIEFCAAQTSLSGPVNVAAPNPLPNADFMRALRTAWGTRLGLPATRWMLECGAVAMRTESELVLKSRRVVPSRLLSAGFEFRQPTWPAAAEDLCRRWRQRGSR